MTTITAARTKPRTTPRARLAAAAVAGPLWTVVSLGQAFTREGYDITREPLSVLSNGALGWVQILNFVVAGVLLLIGAAGFRAALPGVWVARLVALAGAGMIGAGIFVMDPVGAPLSGSSYGHMLAGTTTFTALIAACYVLARHYRSGRDTAASLIAGTALLVGDGWAMSGAPGGSLALAVGAITALLWVSLAAARLR
ncbi:DUF998 domain-containing protein [Cryptosporangium arvum]|uniref:DUF998 domain-containing protein n=1 Tax=Cryptosporangium arvum TaxID=80871 RepID=UPI0004B412E8|nr:DUF998 domain-containing protein [Cryptosporangium arvum]